MNKYENSEKMVNYGNGTVIIAWHTHTHDHARAHAYI